MKKKTLTRLISSLDSVIFNKNENSIKRFFYKLIKKIRVKQTINETINRDMNISLIISFIHFLNDYGFTSYNIYDDYSISCDIHNIDNKQYRLSIIDNQTKQKLQFDTSSGEVDVTYENIGCIYMSTLDKLNELMVDEIRDFLINTIIMAIKKLTTSNKISMLFENRKMY